jgi:4-diphosphocytidyl-2-C-methyl-D-erythritol kinase
MRWQISIKVVQGAVMDEITLKALAKINLGLDVERRREDGYHEVRMVMQTIHLYDVLEISKSGGTGIELSTNLSYLPVNENNLICRAGKLLMDEFHIQDGVKVILHKRIPVAAGMAGGSTDAAAMLYGMNRLFSLGLSRKELMERGVKIGADVPYCIMRGTALAEGIGEKLTALPPMVKCPVLIAKPSISVSTKFVYQNLKLDEQTNHPDIDLLLQDITNQDLGAIAHDMGNVLESVTIPNYPVIAEIKEQMMRSGAVNSMMSGSGPTVFGLFDDIRTAKRAFREMKESGLAKQVYLTSIYNNRRAV